MTTLATPRSGFRRLAAIRGVLARIHRLASVSSRVLKNPTTFAGMMMIVGLGLVALLAPYITDPNIPNPYQMPRDWGAVNAPPGTPGHPLGTTRNGGDVLYGLIWGARTSIVISVSVIVLTLLIGLIVGSLAGLLGGWVEEGLMRIVDMFQAIPELILALAIAAALGPSLRNIVVAIAVVYWARYARLIRAEIIQVKQRQFVDAARSTGASRLSIAVRDVLPNSVTPIIVQGTLDMGRIVLFAATLSFLGLSEAGVAEWGRLVSIGQAGLVSGLWWTSTFAGAMIFIWALSFNLVGDGLRDVLDPRTEGA